MQTGVEVFLKGLRELGYEPVVLDGKPDHVAIDYAVESGKFAGTKLKHGFIVPADFPINPPSGIHVAASFTPFRAVALTPREAYIASRRRHSSKRWEASGNTGHGRPPSGRRARRQSPPT